MLAKIITRTLLAAAVIVAVALIAPGLAGFAGMAIGLIIAVS